jgi:hypothetical protein
MQNCRKAPESAMSHSPQGVINNVILSLTKDGGGGVLAPPFPLLEKVEKIIKCQSRKILSISASLLPRIRHKFP